MFDVIAHRRALKEVERETAAAVSDRGISDYGMMSYFDATYKRDGYTIVLSGRYLYHLAADGRLTELYINEEHLEPEEFASLLDGLFSIVKAEDTH